MNRLGIRMTRRGIVLLIGALLGCAVIAGLSRQGRDRTFAQPGPTVQVVDGGALGPILADSRGFTLYTFDRDTPGASNCTGRCAETWPPLLVPDGTVVAPDGLPGELESFSRADGSMQAMFNDQPLYTYSMDAAPGDTNGEGVGGIWHAARAVSPTVQLHDGGMFGTILTGSNGMTLYTFDRDQDGVSNCSGGCAQTWPPLVLDGGDPVAPYGLAGTLAAIDRGDGQRQVTYNGRPLYFFAADTQPGDTKGDGVGGVWHVAAAMTAAPPAPAATSAPTSTPTPTPTPSPTPTPTPPPPPAPTAPAPMPGPYPYPY